MTEEVDFWTPTVQAFAPLQLPAPELTPKLLKRPPFRFIHDIVAAVNGRFAAYDHIIPAAYVDAASVDTKEKKIEYLEALIAYLEKLLKIKLDVNPKKVVAGSEPEKTNVFLQYLAVAVGLAQQDKANGGGGNATAAADGSATKEKRRGKSKSVGKESKAWHTPAPATGGDGAASSPVTMSHGPDISGGLPNPNSLPRKKSSAAAASAKKAANAAAINEAETFNRKLAGFSINLDTRADAANVRADNQSIVRMWQELQRPQVETTPATMPAESLEMAIKRQLDAIHQVQGLIRENDKVIDKLEGRLV